MALLDTKIAEVEAAIKTADNPVEKRRLKIKREDLMRLRRVEQIYVRSYRWLVLRRLFNISKECSSSRSL
jgi:hypothetical protein